MNYWPIINHNRGKIQFDIMGRTRKDIHRNKIATVDLIKDWIDTSGFTDDQVNLVVHNYAVSLYFSDPHGLMLAKLRFQNATQ